MSAAEQRVRRAEEESLGFFWFLAAWRAEISELPKTKPPTLDRTPGAPVKRDRILF